ncbi:hypothetical protein [Variovorax sp. WDL1]|nr:hypothetical protein [Variovorax sp. WDL1]
MLWALTAAERELLVKWVGTGTGDSRRVAALRKLAGAARLDAAERLLERLLLAGWIAVDERRENGFWVPYTLRWLDLPALQTALGLPTRADRDAARETLDARLAALVESSDGDVQAAARELLVQQPPMHHAVRHQRTELVEALNAWVQEKRRGMRQDFAIFARPHSKAVTESEWKWLADRLPLEELGVERFAPVFWVSGDCCLQFPEGNMQLSAVPFLGIPASAAQQLQAVVDRPSSYWFIENRASFERQASRRTPGTCVIFIAGRPTHAWSAAVDRVLRCAPAVVYVSADADPAGLEIALTVGALAQAAGCAWEVRAMDLASLELGKPLDLNTYDLAAIARLRARSDVPAALLQTLERIEERGAKYEQEAWL